MIHFTSIRELAHIPGSKHQIVAMVRRVKVFGVLIFKSTIF